MAPAANVPHANHPAGQGTLAGHETGGTAPAQTSPHLQQNLSDMTTLKLQLQQDRAA